MISTSHQRSKRKIHGLSSYWIFDSSPVATFHTGNTRLHLKCIFKKKNYHNEWEIVFHRFYVKLLAYIYGNSNVCLLLKVTEVITFNFRNARKDYINAKYIERKYARKKHADNAAKLHALCEAVKSRDILGLVQVYADGVDLTEKIPLANGHVSVVNFIRPIAVSTISFH